RRIFVDREIDAFEVRAEQQVVAVARPGEHVLRRDLAPGAGAVLDDHALAERSPEPIVDVARRQVGLPTRAAADDEPDRLFRIRLRERGGYPDLDQAKDYFANAAHGSSRLSVLLVHSLYCDRSGAGEKS